MPDPVTAATLFFTALGASANAVSTAHTINKDHRDRKGQEAQRTPTHHDEVRQFHYSCGGQSRVTYHGDGGFTVAGTRAGDWSFGFLKEEKTVYYGSGSGQQGGNSASGFGGQNGGWNNRTLGQGAQQSLPYGQRQAISYGGGGGVVGQKTMEYHKRGGW